MTTEPAMPPVPDGRGKECIPFLEYHGLVARVPPIRSSDFELALNDPFRYYLTRRLGIVPAHSWSPALARGSWMHKCFEHDLFSSDEGLTLKVFNTLDNRINELTETNKSLGIVGDSHRDLLARERLDVETSLGWYHAARSVKISDKHGTFPQFLSQLYWRILARELPISHSSLLQPAKVPSSNGILDLLLHDTRHNTLWILDLKSCSEPAVNRLSTCALEFQTQHYLHILSNHINIPLWRRTYDLPDNVRIAGMMHLAIQKPDIKFCNADRNFREFEFIPNKGKKNQGIPRMEKEFFGEPVLANYIKRCQQWYTGTGDYLHLAPERTVSPTVNISFSPIEKVLDQGGLIEYTSRMAFLEKLAMCPAYPANFIRSASALRSFGKLSKYAPFALTPPRLWPEIIEREGFIVAHREEETAHVEEDRQEEVSQE